MDRFNYLLRKRTKALRVFQKAKNSLNTVTVQLNDEITKSINTIEARRKDIELEEQAIEFAKNELNAATKTIVKINELLA